MKRKLVTLLMSTLVVISLVGCGGTKETEEPTVSIEQEVVEQEVVEQESTEVVVDDSDLGSVLSDKFLEIVEADEVVDIELIHQIFNNDLALPFELVGAEVAPGLLVGFGNTEITGFSRGYQFAPMIGSIPFIGYVFELSEEANITEFKKVLSENADLRWNICTEAEKTVIVDSGNKVLFLMCNSSYES